MARLSARHKVRPVDPAATRTVNELVTALGACSFQGRNLALALDVWEAMARDRRCFRVLSLAGAMVPAGMSLLVIRLLERRLVDAIVCTGATVSHDLCNTVDPGGQAHYLGSEQADDAALRRARVNRIYDTLLPERNFLRAERAIVRLLPRLCYDTSSRETESISTRSFLSQLGRLLPGRSILTTAARLEVPIFVPGIADSELGLDVEVGNRLGAVGPGRRVVFDTLRDIGHFAELIKARPRAGLVSTGGGVPRNWAQQVYPFLAMDIFGPGRRPDGYRYGVRITTDRPEFGGLSGCSISESKSWGKYQAQAREASVVCDATIALPVLVSALLQRSEARRDPARRTRAAGATPTAGGTASAGGRAGRRTSRRTRCRTRRARNVGSGSPSAARQASSGKFTPARAEPATDHQKRGFISSRYTRPVAVSRRRSMLATPLQRKRAGQAPHQVQAPPRPVRTTRPRRGRRDWPAGRPPAGWCARGWPRRGRAR
jgi:deoxyhypusine synthase